jgi:hypothetical protein
MELWCNFFLEAMIGNGALDRYLGINQLKIVVPEVPDFAMVPRFLIRSSLVIPTPLSRIERTLFSLSNLICMCTVQRLEVQF